MPLTTAVGCVYCLIAVCSFVVTPLVAGMINTQCDAGSPVQIIAYTPIILGGYGWASRMYAFLNMRWRIPMRFCMCLQPGCHTVNVGVA